MYADWPAFRNNCMEAASIHVFFGKRPCFLGSKKYVLKEGKLRSGRCGSLACAGTLGARERRKVTSTPLCFFLLGVFLFVD